MRLAKEYPGDVGVLSAFFFNYVELVPGQAIYLDANEPHAYLSGECLECMATSDNVVRAGLTPKYIDTNTLCQMLTYKQVGQTFPSFIVIH
jgi:mannose-6-phosphate isomerase